MRFVIRAGPLAGLLRRGKHHSSKDIMALEHKHAAHNYHPLPCVFSRAKGIHVWDPEGKQYMDFLSAYSAVNQGKARTKGKWHVVPVVLS